MPRTLRLTSIIIILAALLASTAATETKLNAGLSRVDNPTLPLMWEQLDRPQNFFKQSGGEKSGFHGFPQIEAVWTGPTQWMTGVNWGGETFNGGLSTGEDFFGSNLGATDFVKVQIIFESDTSKQTLCKTFRVDLGWAVAGIGTFPGSAWDVSDPLNPRRLNLCFTEYSPAGNVNHQWDPTTESISLEYLQVMKSDYDSSGMTYAGINIRNDAPTLDILYDWYPIVAAGHTFFESEPCTLTITPYYIDNLIGVPNETEIILDWRYIGGLSIDGFNVYCDTVSQPSEILATVSAASTRFTHSDLTTGKTYYYRIEATDSVAAAVATSKELSVIAQAVSSNVNLFDFWNERSKYGDCWGYTDTAGNEYALICARDEGVSIIDLSTTPISEVGFLNPIVPGNDHKDVKIYKNYAIVVSEYESTQIFDISDVTAPVQVSTIAHVFGSGAHNCKVDGDFLYIVGDHNGGRLLVYDILDPASPWHMTTFGPYYYHDIDIYNDTLYAAGISGHGIDVLDISDKASISLIANFNWTGSGAHNAAVFDSGRYVAIGDEIGTGPHTRIFDVQSLENVTKVADIIVNPSVRAHNCYEKNGILYIAHYQEGLRMYNVIDPTNPKPVGFYDTYLGPDSIWTGNWNVYPYLPSGKILLSDIESGLFVVELSEPDSCLIQNPGDANGDGSIATVQDLVFLINFLQFGSPAPVPLANGDINGDCIINMDDLEYMIGGGTPVDCTCLEPTVVFGCCFGNRGDINGDGDDLTILDLTFIVDFIFRGSGDPGSCPEEADFNSDGDAATILDLTFAVDFIFRGGAAAGPCP